MMGKYLEKKEQYSDCILFYRLGDFYEMFFDDAICASRELELTLTGKNCGLEERAPMCGVPHHSASIYVQRLVEKGYKVAICEQVEDPKSAKGLVEREVVRVVTPGTLVDEDMLDDKKNNYLAVCCKINGYGLAFCDISTGEMYSCYASKAADVFNELARYQPREIITDTVTKEEIGEALTARFSCNVDAKNTEYFSEHDLVTMHFEESMTEGMNTETYSAVSGLMKYLIDTQKNSIEFINRLVVYGMKDFMELDLSTRRSLEICETMRDKAKNGSLLGVLDKTKTSMGARRLKQWLEKPLVNPIEINKRLYGVEELVNNTMLRRELAHALEGIYDISRILTRVSLMSVTPRDLASLRESLRKLPEIKYLLNGGKTVIIKDLYNRLDIMDDLFTLLESAVMETPGVSIKDGNVIADGFSDEIDELRSILKNGKKYIDKQEEQERERTGIKTLKISYNKVFGYYIEVTKANSELVPDNYIRKQTLVNSERYITPELKEFEDKILNASDRILTIESDIYEKLRLTIYEASERIKTTCDVISDADALVSFAEVAVKNNYTKPEICQSGELIIKDSRHPVVENMQRKTVFVPNDVIMDNNENRLLMITGPNMAGKSTYMRQTALIVLMAQTGSFVPASFARISVTDRIFTRVGASDDIAQGQSTFMLEMTEVANILENATKDSLLILDEIGRGTSTFDGLSIAWAVAEYAASRKKLGAKTLFATHYHELCKLEGSVEGVKNYSVAVKKRGDDITFLRKIVRGGTDDSFGIEVAALAGVPKEVVARAKKVLKEIEENGGGGASPVVTVKADDEFDMQVGFGDTESVALKDELAALDVTTFTPIEAMNKLYELSMKAKEIDKL